MKSIMPQRLRCNAEEIHDPEAKEITNPKRTYESRSPNWRNMKRQTQRLPSPQLHATVATSNTVTRRHPRTRQTNTQEQILTPPRRRQLRLPKRAPEHNLAIRPQNLRPRTAHLWRARRVAIICRIGPVTRASVARFA
jgi:hypothetical protein